jgi:hypothetical protein
VSRAPAGWDVDSPVQAEVFVVWLDGDQLALTGPDGPQPWILQLGPTEHPVEVVDRLVRDDVVDATIEHAQRIHNMTATREHVLAALRAPDAFASEATAG